jgi:hypothetical protein
MGGRASLIMVIGFAVIFGIINLNIAKLTSRSVGNMIGYNESSLSRIVANSGANAGMAMISSLKGQNMRGTILNKDFTDKKDNFYGSGYTVTATVIAKSGKIPAYLRLRSVSRCTTFVKNKSGDFYVLSDTVEVRMDSTTVKSFSELGYMTVKETSASGGTINFTTGDTLYGKVHSNDVIHTNGAPVFWDNVTTSQTVSKASGSVPVYKKPPNKAEEHVPTRDFPSDLNESKASATNNVASQTAEIFVTLKPGTASDNDGYAIISTAVATTATVSNLTGYDKKGNPIYDTHTVTNYNPGTKLDSIKLSGDPSSSYYNNVIYSTKDIHVAGTLDGNLTICAGLSNIRIENDIRYQNEPDPTKPLTDAVNQTTDMLGLLAYKDISIADNTNNHLSDIYLDAAVFCLTGSFGAENYDSRIDEGYIKLIGSIAQYRRGAVGTSSSPHTGFYKSYRYDTRMNPDGAKDADGELIVAKHPPVYPGFVGQGPLAIKSWWESTRKPFNIDEYY